MTARQLERRHERGVARWTQSAPFQQGARLGGEQAPKAAGEVLQQLSRYVECAGARRAAAQDHGQQLRIGQGLRSAFQQPLAWPFPARPATDAAGRPLDDKLLIHRAIMAAAGAGAEPPIGRESPVTEGMVTELK